MTIMKDWLPEWSSIILHVKWFANDELWYPQSMSKVITPTFLFWLAFTLVALLIASFFNERMEHIKLVRRFHFFLNKLKRFQLSILRIGLSLGLILQLFTGTFLAPPFVSDHAWVYVTLVVALLGLVHRRLLFISGIALTVLYSLIFIHYGIFHALDYAFYIGIIYYLFAANSKWQSTAPMILYLSTGLSLAWVAMEKLTLPQLATSLMHEYHLPTLGFAIEDFVLISAFIELGLAWAFIVGILNRFSAFLLSSIFLLTTTVFGFTEIVGHTVMHTILLMFIISGNDEFNTMFKFHRTMKLRCLFVIVNFCVLVFGLMAIYIWIGQSSIGH